MRAFSKKQQGVSTLIMILAIGAAMAASLYGAYSHIEASSKSQGTSSARIQARALAQDALAAASGYLNMQFCGSTTGTCVSGTSANLSPTAIPAGMVLLNYPATNPIMNATVVNNTFATNGQIEVDTAGYTPTAQAGIRAYLHAATVYTTTPFASAFLINGNQNLTGNVSINTGTSSMMVMGNLSVGGSANITGTALATGTITGCSTTAVCTSNDTTSGIVSPAIDAYNLSLEANAVLSVDANGNPQVTFENNADLTPAGTTLLSDLGSSTALCAGGGDSCISLASGNTASWTITGTPSPGVLFFYGDVDVASGAINNAAVTPATTPPSYVTGNTIIATGNVLIETKNNIASYGQMQNVCNPTTNPTVVPVNVCPLGPTTANNGEGTGAVANAVIISGGSVNYPYVGGGTVYVNGASSTAIPPVNDTTESAASNTTQPSGTVNGYTCTTSSGSVGSVSSCATTSAILTGGVVTLKGNSNLTGVVAASESLTALGNGTILGMIDTADANMASSSLMGNTTSTNDVNGNLKIIFAPGVSNNTNFGGGGNTPELAFVPQWQRYTY
ncbi:MAG: hypothetical protein ACYDEV_12880 [Acidiferrobacter sp.]